MTSQQSLVDFLVGQLEGAGTVSARKMFGEYGIFCDGKMVAIFGDDQLFLKPTITGKKLAGKVKEVSPYPGSKPCLLIPAERWDDREWMTELVRETARELPLPKKKRPK